MISELTSYQREDTNLLAAFAAEGKGDTPKRLNADELLISATKRIIEEDNKLRSIRLMKSTCRGDVSTSCREK